MKQLKTDKKRVAAASASSAAVVGGDTGDEAQVGSAVKTRWMNCIIWRHYLNRRRRKSLIAKKRVEVTIGVNNAAAAATGEGTVVAATVLLAEKIQVVMMVKVKLNAAVRASTVISIQDHRPRQLKLPQNEREGKRKLPKHSRRR